MPKTNSGFLGVAAALLAMSFVAGFFTALFNIGPSNELLHIFKLRWELNQALLYIAAWAPAVLLVASAIAMESSSASDGFAGEAYRIMAPALALALIVSLFYLLIVPGLEERKNRYESQSQLFNESLKKAEAAKKAGKYDEAERYLQVCATVDQLDKGYETLNNAVRSMIIQERSQRESSAPPTDSIQADDKAWLAGNRFYLEALDARAAGRIFDAHYLAKRSAAIYSKRPEVMRLVDETWRDLQRLGPSAEAEAEAKVYKRKLDGYTRFQEGDYLEAYRIYLELAAENPDDEETKTYLARSTEGLSSIAFFLEELNEAFSRSDVRQFAISRAGPGSNIAKISSSRASASDDAVYFSDLSLSISGDTRLILSAPYARLHGNTLILRAIDRLKPHLVWEPDYEAGKVAGDPGFAITVPFTQEDAELALILSVAPEDIPLMDLFTSVDKAQEIGIDSRPLLVELGARAAYPFAVIMLVLIGAGLGVRFKPREPIGNLNRYLTAPILVALALAPLKLIGSVETIIANAFATWIPVAAFLPAWLGFMGACVVASLLVAARIAGRTLK